MLRVVHVNVTHSTETLYFTLHDRLVPVRDMALKLALVILKFSLIGLRNANLLYYWTTVCLGAPYYEIHVDYCEGQ